MKACEALSTRRVWLVRHALLLPGVKRLIYTGTIASYYAGAKAGTITEQTPLDRDSRRRNYYARAKSAAVKPSSWKCIAHSSCQLLFFGQELL